MKKYPEVKWKNIAELMRDNAKRLKDKTALIYADDDTKVSYEEFDKITHKAANFLLKLGVRKGDKVTAIVYASLEYVYIMFGALKIGAVFNPVNINLNPEELEYIINDSDAKIVFVDEENLEKVKKIKNKIKVKHIVGVNFQTREIKKFDEIKSYSENYEAKQSVTLDNEALLVYSSGTTGNPKGVLLTHGNMFAEGTSIGKVLKLKEDVISLNNLPLFFIGGIMPVFFTTLCRGGTVVLNKKFSKSKFWERIERYKVNFTFLVPTMFSILLNPPEDIKNKKYNLKSLKFLLSSAAPLPVELLKKFEDVFKIPIFESYGLTENAAWATINPIDVSKRKIGSVGLPFPGVEIRIVDEKDKELPPEKEGEVLIKGPVVMKGYHNKPEITKETLKNGWLYTGDLGYLDKEGYLYITGRKKELIIRGGENISPRQIDEILYKHPEIADAATVGVPDEMYGEEVKAFVVLKQDKKADEKTAQEIIDYCKKHIAEHKCPKKIEFINNIPKGSSGKILRRKLVERK